MMLGYDRPQVQNPPQHPPVCCTQKTITVPPSVNPKTAQKHDYPSPQHRRSYNRRTTAERAYATLGDPPPTTSPATAGAGSPACRNSARSPPPRRSPATSASATRSTPAKPKTSGAPPTGSPQTAQTPPRHARGPRRRRQRAAPAHHPRRPPSPPKTGQPARTHQRQSPPRKSSPTTARHHRTSAQPPPRHAPPTTPPPHRLPSAPNVNIRQGKREDL
jgi:hypothetical protein